MTKEASANVIRMQQTKVELFSLSVLERIRSGEIADCIPYLRAYINDGSATLPDCPIVDAGMAVESHIRTPVCRGISWIKGSVEAWKRLDKDLQFVFIRRWHGSLMNGTTV